MAFTPVGTTGPSLAFFTLVLALSSAIFVLELLILSRLFHPAPFHSRRLLSHSGHQRVLATSTTAGTLARANPCTALRCTTTRSIFVRPVSSRCVVARGGSPAALDVTLRAPRVGALSVAFEHCVRSSRSPHDRIWTLTRLNKDARRDNTCCCLSFVLGHVVLRRSKTNPQKHL